MDEGSWLRGRAAETEGKEGGALPPLTEKVTLDKPFLKVMCKVINIFKHLTVQRLPKWWLLMFMIGSRAQEMSQGQEGLQG